MRMRRYGLSVGFLAWVLSAGWAVVAVAGEESKFREAELKDLEVAGKLEVLDLAINKVSSLSFEEEEQLEEQGADDKAIRERLAKLGDIYFEKIGRGCIIVGSKAVMKFEEDQIVGLAGQNPSKLVYPGGMLPVSPEDYLLVRMVRGGYALVYVRERTQECLKLVWIVNGGGDKPFEKDALEKFVDAVSRNRKAGQ